MEIHKLLNTKVAAFVAKLEDLPNLRAYFAEKKTQQFMPVHYYLDVDGKLTEAWHKSKEK